uniref:CoA-binding domain-containing protein n=1 Tax=Pyrodinium bahamense TaxID=73915 RepID=A0A7S0FVW0_9DINO
MSAPPRWEVIGGGDKGGVLVRTGKELSSEQLLERLATGSLVEELAVAGDRLHFKKLQGDGPDTGWVSIRLKDKELLRREGAVQRAPACRDGPEMIEQQCWAVVGRGTNDVVQQLLEHLQSHGRTAVHVDPYGASGSEVPKSLADLPPDTAIDVVDLCANPNFGQKVIEDCRALGISNVFIQPGASSPEIEARCKEGKISFHNGCVLREML